MRGAASAMEAFAHLDRGFQPQAILCDQRLRSGESGVDVLKALFVRCPDASGAMVSGEHASPELLEAEQDGYLVLRKSAARATPHVLWVGDEGLQHYSPGAPLGHPVHALIGYDGVVWDREMTDAPPVPLRGVVIGALILAVGVIGWALGRLWRKAWK